MRRFIAQTALTIVSDIVLIAAPYFMGGCYYADGCMDGYMEAGLLAAAIFVVTSFFMQVYSRASVDSPNHDATSITIAWSITIFLLLITAYSLKVTSEYSRVVTTIWIIATPVFLIVARACIVSIIPSDQRRIAIVGANEYSVHFSKALRSLGSIEPSFYDDAADLAFISKNELHHRGDLAKLIADVKQGNYDEVYIGLPIKDIAKLALIIDELGDCSVPVRYVPDFFASRFINTRIFYVKDVPVVSIYDTPHTAFRAFIKRAEDLVLGFAIVTVIAVPMLVIALLIKLSSPGPVIFRQRRYGLGGEEIIILKFRSMTVLEDNPALTQAKKNDPRVTPIGVYLRKFSLDELPQFFNVLQGTMSIVGPRPHAVAHNEEYRKYIPGYMLRHLVKPGITGWAQINGWRGETDTLEKMQNRVLYDLEYINNWSLWLDLKIIFLTVLKGFWGKHVY